MEKNSYIVILPWMLTTIGPSGNDLLCYALIYGYSQGQQGGYFGSRTHLGEALNIARRTATDVLARLEERGLVKKHTMVMDGVQRCLFVAVVPDEVKGDEPPRKPQKQTKPAEKKRFVPPTLEEVRTYCAQRGNRVDAERFHAYYTANGWVQGRGKPIKNWRAAVVTWEKQEKSLNYGSKESIIERRRAEILDEVARADERYRQKVAGSKNPAGLPAAVESVSRLPDSRPGTELRPGGPKK